MTHTRTLSLLTASLLTLACGAGSGKTTTDASAGSSGGDSSGATTEPATTALTTGATSTSGASAGNTSGTGEASTGTTTTGGTTTGGTTTTTDTTGKTTGDTSTGSTGTTDTGTTGTTGEACQGQGQSCAGVGALCCAGLECCAGVPVPEGKEFCSNNCPISDRNLKTDFATVDPAQVLSRVVELPISTWRYRKDGAEVRHLGPMAQDFHAAFGLWDTDRMIFPLDASGVSLAAIQALNARLVAAEADNEALRARLERLERAIEARPARP